MRSLGPAARGYEYQDLYSACVLVDLALGALVEIAVDRKLFSDDRFDDLTTIATDLRRNRVQIKHTVEYRPLPATTFITDERALRLDRLLASARADRDGPGAGAVETIYRVVLRDGTPTDPVLTTVLRRADPDPGPLVTGAVSERFQFDAEALWAGVLQPASGPRKAGNAYGFFHGGNNADRARADLAWFCEHLVVEIGAPAMSGDLLEPGPLERVLLNRVTGELGAGRFPNDQRMPIDVAAALVGLARAARQGLAEVSAEEVLRRTQLRQDFGAVATVSVVDPALVVSRRPAVASLADLAEDVAGAGGCVLGVAPPGQGKSWVGEQLISELTDRGWLVAEHYCFVGDADGDRLPRVMAESVFGTLLDGIAQVAPDAVRDQRPRFAADEAALVAALARAREGLPDRRIALLVDGLDHVTRVRGVGPGAQDPSTILAGALSELEMPQGCVLVVLSQPGAHLEPLDTCGARRTIVPPLARSEVEALAARHGLNRPTGESAGDDSDGVIGVDLLDALADRSGGNALYATYLCREVARAPAVMEAAAVVVALPPFDGTLHAYYDHLHTALGEGAWAADVIALLDAPVTEADLVEISPQLAHRVGPALDVLAPVLQVGAPSGVLRIYHESFARYLREAYQGHPEALAAQLGSIALWLEGRGLFTDNRAFRLLLGMLNDAGRSDRVLELIDRDFVANSIGAGFPARLVRTNLAAGVRAAAMTGDWRAATRCVELARAAATFEYERFESTMVPFIDVATEVVGAQPLADRLLDDQRPAVPGRAGLIMCAALDAIGAVAPWLEYLEAFRREQDDHTSYGTNSNLAVQEAMVRGRLRLSSMSVSSDIGDDDWRSAPVDLGLVAEWLDEGLVRCEPTVRTMLDTCDAANVLELIRACSDPGPVWLALAEELNAGVRVPADFPSARTSAITAIAHGVGDGQAHRLLQLGVPVDLLVDDPSSARARLLDLARAVQTTVEDGVEQRWRDEWLPAWSDQVVVAARADRVGLDAAEALVGGDGWYPCFLRCSIAVARSEAAPVPDRSRLALEALRHLTVDTRPFVGSPRACDLFPVWSTVKGVIRRAVDQLDDGDWEQGVRLVAAVAGDVNTSMRGEMGGPLSADWVLDMVVATVPDNALEVAREMVLREIGEGSGGRFYADLAEYRLFAGRLALREENADELAACWREACWLLTGYGFHKDITVYDLLDPLPSLIEADPARARLRIQRVQALCERLPMHTDGKETNWAPTRWWSCLANADPVGTIALAAPQLLAAVNENYSRIRLSIDDVWNRWTLDADPLVAACLRIAIDPPLTDNDQDLLVRLAGAGMQENARRDVARLLVARADERPISYSASNSDDLAARDDEKLRAINRGALAAGVDEVNREVPTPAPPSAPTGYVRDEESLLDRIDRLHGLSDPPVPSGALGIARALTAWRRHDLNREDGAHLNRPANVIGYRLVELLQDGRPADAAAALRRVVTLLDFGHGIALMRALADGLLKLGWNDLAAQAYSLHWTRSRGGGGWLTFGGESALDSLREASRLNPGTASDVIMKDLELLVGGSRPYGLDGLTEALVLANVHGALAERGPDIAFDIWDEAFAVISARAPRMAPSDDPDRPYNAPTPDTGTPVVGDLNQAYANATVSGLANPERAAKRRALLASRLLLEHRPELAGPAISHAIRALDDPGTLAWLLALVREAGAPAEVTDACRAELVQLARGTHLTVRALARALLPAEDRPELGPSDPSLIPAEPTLWSPPSVTSSLPVNMRRAIALQAGERISIVESAIPGLGAGVLREASAHIEAHLERFKAQIRGLGFTSNDDDWPDGLTMLEQTIEATLQELASAGRGLALAVGAPPLDPETWELDLAQELLDDPTVSLDLEATRYPRPALAPPGSTAAGPSVTSVQVLQNEAWAIVASYEQHRPRPDRFSATAGSVRAQGLELHFEAGGPRATDTDPPLIHGRLSDWLRPSHWRVSVPEVGDLPLFGVDFNTGPAAAQMGLGLPPALVTPTPWLIDRLRLRPGRGFMMFDDQGPALAMVTWRARYVRSDYHLPYPTLMGSGAALRPDLLKALDDLPSSTVRSRAIEQALSERT